MKSHALILILLSGFLFTACSSSKSISNLSSTKGTVQTSTNDGTSFENAVVIHEKTETKGIAAEYAWLDAHYPGYKIKSQSLKMNKKRVYDVLSFKTKQGKDMEIYFDITDFFGKF